MITGNLLKSLPSTIATTTFFMSSTLINKIGEEQITHWQTRRHTESDCILATKIVKTANERAVLNCGLELLWNYDEKNQQSETQFCLLLFCWFWFLFDCRDFITQIISCVCEPYPTEKQIENNRNNIDKKRNSRMWVYTITFCFSFGLFSIRVGKPVA